MLTRGEGPDGRLAVTAPAEVPQLDDYGLDEIGRAVEFLTLTQVRKEAAASGQPMGQARFTLTDNLTITITGQQDGETVWLRLAAAGDDEAARLNARWRGWALALSGQTGSFDAYRAPFAVPFRRSVIIWSMWCSSIIMVEIMV